MISRASQSEAELAPEALGESSGVEHRIEAEAKPLITGPGRYPTECGKVATIRGPFGVAWVGGVEGMEDHFIWCSNGDRHSKWNHPEVRIIGPRLPDAPSDASPDSLADRDLLETIEGLRKTGLELAAKNRQAIVERDEARAELAAMKGGMIQRVGQRFVNGKGVIVTIVDRWNIDIRSRWEGRKASGHLHFYDDAGKSNVGERWPEESLVGPAPDELAEARAEAQRQHDRVRQLLGSRLSAEKFAKLLHDPATSDALNGDDVRKLLEDAIDSEYVPARRSSRGPEEEEEEGWFRGAPLGNGRYARSDSALVAFALPPKVPFTRHDVEFVATRIDSADGDGVIYEVERA